MMMMQMLRIRAMLLTMRLTTMRLMAVTMMMTVAVTMMMMTIRFSVPSVRLLHDELALLSHPLPRRFTSPAKPSATNPSATAEVAIVRYRGKPSPAFLFITNCPTVGNELTNFPRKSHPCIKPGCTTCNATSPTAIVDQPRIAPIPHRTKSLMTLQKSLMGLPSRSHPCDPAVAHQTSRIRGGLARYRGYATALLPPGN